MDADAMKIIKKRKILLIIRNVFFSLNEGLVNISVCYPSWLQNGKTHTQMVDTYKHWTMTINVMTMFIFILLLAIRGTFGLKCGPGNVCTCSYHQTRSVTIQCNGTRIHAHDICNYIKASNLSSLRIRLDLSRNNISSLNRSSLEGCKHTTAINLSENRLRSLDADVFSDMTNLTELDLSNNSLAAIYQTKSTRILENLPHLQHLRLNGNFETISDHNSSVQHSNALHDNTINSHLRSTNTGRWEYFYPDLSNLTALMSLTIDGLYNTAFGPSYLSLTHLEHINLNGSVGVCNISHLTGEIFRNLPYVKTLDLSQCNLVNIDAETFVPLTKLLRLDLSLNRKLELRVARNVSYGLQFTQIEFVNYSYTHKTFGLGTKLRMRDICYLRNTTLREISFRGNRLELFEDNFILLLPPSLQEMHLEDNRFTFGLYLLQLGCLANLTTFLGDRQNVMHDPRIYMEQNFTVPDSPMPIHDDCPFMTDAYLRNISASLPSCPLIGRDNIGLSSATLPPKLKKVSFVDCNLQYRVGLIPVLPFMNEIEHVDLSGNVLFSLDGPLGPLLSFKFLNVSRNYCSYIGPKFFSFMHSLETLDMRHNFLSNVLANDTQGEMFKGLFNLKYLIVSSNQIKTLPTNMLQYLVSLHHLDLSHNTIDVFNLSVSHLTHLTTLDLSNNAIQTLPEHVFNHFKTQHNERGRNFSINLYRNPIQCSCNNRKFLQWMLESKHNFPQFDDYTFMNEEGLTMDVKDFIKTVHNFDKTCRSYTIVIVVCTLSISLFLCTIIVGVIYKNRWKLRYLFYMSNRKFYGYLRLSDEAPIANFKFDAFISYADDDINFILQEIIPNLENDGCKLCIHQRDFLPGNAIADNIINAIQSSKRTIVILSITFLKRKWCVYEFNMARMESIYSRNGSGCLLVVFLEHVPLKDMSLEMVQWITNESYIEFTRDEEGYQLFWNNLKDAIKTDRD